MKYLYKISFILTLLLVVSCNEDDSIVLDVNDPANSIAQINGGTVLTFNPVEDVVNIVNIGVSTLSDSDRSYTVSIDMDNTTLESSFYNIPSLTGVIPAGSFIGELVINTPIPSSFPETDAVLTLVLESVEGAQLLETSNLSEELGITVACPTVELELVVGEGVTTSNPLLEAFGVDATFSDPRTVVMGPGSDQITIIGGLSPDIGSSDIILTVDLETGLATGTATPEETTEDLPLGNSFNNGGVPTRTTLITGQILSCIGQISFTLDNGTFAPPFNSNTVVLEF
ncbi:hypothetical protein [uncultured Dokdonia sp.]|uniref:hypothetical protein n=1 Tax=uncultured Dokdonia sp. TaxID=575653 RepID=UPI00261F15D6|nr:hypothetical protein [uncultured Dokdonia sp.]